jgi:metallo-beta-lactamase class B
VPLQLAPAFLNVYIDPTMRIRRILVSIAFTLCGSALLLAQSNAEKWSQPFPPYKIAGNLYFVGSSELASYLITTPQGNILINSDFEQTVPVIRAAVEKLGFRFADTKILLGSHAHGDHMEGDALVKELTGARVMAMEQDLPALRQMTPGNKPHPVDHVLHDGEEVTLGGTTLVAHLTAGHTKGCTTWTMKAREGDKTYNVVIVGSVNVNPGFILVGNKDYPEIASDYARSFKTLKALPCDIFLGAHGAYYGMIAKYGRMEKGEANPFIDPTGYQAYLTEREQAFLSNLEQQLAAR